jgi:hypothetical protein
MATTRKTATATRRSATPRPLDPGTILRLHATTALSRLMRADHEGARGLLSGLAPEDVAVIARDAERLAATARLTYADLTDGRPVPGEERSA